LSIHLSLLVLRKEGRRGGEGKKFQGKVLRSTLSLLFSQRKRRGREGKIHLWGARGIF